MGTYPTHRAIIRNTVAEITIWLFDNSSFRSWDQISYEGPKTRFIEVHPEITYRIPRGIECDYLYQDSFAAFMREEALLHLANAGKAPRL